MTDLTNLIIEESYFLSLEELGGLLDADPSLVDAMSEKWDQPPLHAACTEGFLKIVLLLLDRGASINKRDRLGWTALLRASRSGQVEVVSLLLERGADPSLVGHDGETALTMAANGVNVREYGCDHTGVISLLLSDGRVPVNARTRKEGFTALYLACLSKRVDAARLLLVEGGADLTIPTARGDTAFALCTLLRKYDSSRDEIAQLLEVRRSEAEKELNPFMQTRAPRQRIECGRLIHRRAVGSHHLP